MLTAIRARLGDDAGIGMILVIGITVFVAGLTVTAATIAQNGLGQSRQRINFERSMASAESGIDYALGHLQYAFDEAGADYPIPSEDVAPSADCPAAEIELPDLKNVNEKQWAKAQLKLLVEQHPECLIDTPDGQVMVLKPKNRAGGAGIQYGRVYAMGWSPAYGDPRASARTVKAEYVFMPYRPKHAILTGPVPDAAVDQHGRHGCPWREPEGGQRPHERRPDRDRSAHRDRAGELRGLRNRQLHQLQATTPPRRRRISGSPKVSAVGFYAKAPKVDADAMLNWPTCARTVMPGMRRAPVRAPAPKVGWEPLQGLVLQPGTTDLGPPPRTRIGTYFVHEGRRGQRDGQRLDTEPNGDRVRPSGPRAARRKQYGNIMWDHYDTPAPRSATCGSWPTGTSRPRRTSTPGRARRETRSRACTSRARRSTCGPPPACWWGRSLRRTSATQRHGSSGQATRSRARIVKFEPNAESPVLQPDLHNPVAGIRGLSPNH